MHNDTPQEIQQQDREEARETACAILGVEDYGQNLYDPKTYWTYHTRPDGSRYKCLRQEGFDEILEVEEA